MNIAQIRLITGHFLVIFLWLHLPLVALVGLFVGTAGWIMPTLGTLILVVAATLNWRLAPGSDSGCYTISVALMGVIAILVYEFDGDPWQIDIHMYFFAALAMLTAFCDWRTLVLATAVVAVHHLLLNFIYPAAVFPSGVSLPRVILHAVILVVEAGTLIYVSLMLAKAFKSARQALDDVQDAHQAAMRATAERDLAAEKAARDRKAAMLALADTFETNIMRVVNTVSSSVTELQSTAASLSSVAQQTNNQATAVAASAEQASANIQTVTTSTDQLSASVMEIARQAADSARASSIASAEAANTNVMVQSLVQAADKIGAVVNLINSIAAQTNLLALNATIEAARAGDAGKGFAVVAGEVKHLANQTGRATEEIAGQITAVQEETKHVVAAIQKIATVIDDVRNISSGIAAAVKQQGADTQDITRNVEEASKGTREVAANITGVMQTTVDTRRAVKSVSGSADNLAKDSGLLRSEVDKFLALVRAY